MIVVSRSAAASDVGKVRANNQDSGYAGQHLFLVADGVGGNVGGDIASAIALQRIIDVDHEFEDPKDAEASLRESILSANRVIAETVGDHPELAGMATTLSSLIFSGEKMVLAHIGDSRIYRLRNGKYTQISTDHTFVQRLVDTGRITAEEAMTHPRRSVVMRVLGDIDEHPDVDTAILDTIPGDRWLICSDGLSDYVERAVVAREMRRSLADPQHVADTLIQLALERGAPDNVTVVIADVGDAIGNEVPELETRIVGSAANPLDFAVEADEKHRSRLPQLLLAPLQPFRTPQLTAESEVHHEISDEYLDELVDEQRKRRRNNRIFLISWIVLLLGVIATSLFVAYEWTQTQYYVGIAGDEVAIYQGVSVELGPLRLSSVAEVTDISVADLPQFYQDRLESTIPAGSLEDARRTVESLQ